MVNRLANHDLHQDRIVGTGTVASDDFDHTVSTHQPEAEASELRWRGCQSPALAPRPSWTSKPAGATASVVYAATQGAVSSGTEVGLVRTARATTPSLTLFCLL